MTLYINGKEVLSAIVMHGTWTASGTVTLPAFTLGGNIDAGGNYLQNVTLLTGSSGSVALYVNGLRNAANAGAAIVFSSLSATDANTNRMIISGGIDTALVSWGACTHAGLVLSGALDVAGQYLTFLERAAPGAGAANEARMYAIVDGGTLTDMACVFQDGTVDIFAQEVTPLDAPHLTESSGSVGKMVMRKPHPGHIKFVMRFASGGEFVVKEIEYHDKDLIEANVGCDAPLPADWDVTTAVEREARAEAEALQQIKQLEE